MNEQTTVECIECAGQGGNGVYCDACLSAGSVTVTGSAAVCIEELRAEVRAMCAKLDAVPEYVDYRRGWTDWDTGVLSFDEWCERYLEVQP